MKTMENTDAKVFLMIEDLSRGALAELLGCAPDEEHSHTHLAMQARDGYENGTIPAEEIIAAWNDDTWNGQ